jgi:hypothetical protein
MRDKLKGIGIVLCVIGVVLIIPSIIKGMFWILLQMMYYPLTTLIIVTNLFIWQYLWIKYSEKKQLNK